MSPRKSRPATTKERRRALADAAPDLLRELKLALAWLDEIYGDQFSETLITGLRPRGALAPWANRLLTAMPNNWNGRIGIRAAIAKAEGK